MWIIWLLFILMAIKLYNKLSSGRCYADSILTGKVVLITGGTSGVGYETALDLVFRGAKVILTCRDGIKGKRAVDRIKSIAKTDRVRYEILDLSSVRSIRSFVNVFTKVEARLDVLINNASAYGTDRSITVDGMIKDMQVNYFGQFLLTLLLTPLLKKSEPSRVIIVSSIFHRLGTIDNITEPVYGTLRTYANSKLCNVLFSNALARRLEGTGVAVNCVDPGIVFTFVPKIIGKIGTFFLLPFLKDFKEAAQTSIFMACSEEGDQVSGKYFADCREGSMSAKAKDTRLGEKLWAISEVAVKLRPGEAI